MFDNMTHSTAKSATQSENSEPVAEVPAGAAKDNGAGAAAKGNGADAAKGNGAGALPDPTNLLSLAIDPATYLQTGAVTRVRQILVGKPGPQTFFRVHPSPDYRRAFKMVEIKDDDREEYIVMPAFEEELSGEIVIKMIYTTIDRHGTIRLWPARLPHEDDRKSMRWYTSAHEAAETAMGRWIRLKANMHDGAYETLIAESEIPEPNWRELPSFGDVLPRAFGNRVIDSIDHPAIKHLRGKL
jgi:hypothetical protein